MWHSDVAPGLIYSVIAPLVLVFSSITFGLLWVVFRYNLLYVTISRPDTRGLLYPTALTQLFTGIYVMELCMIGLLLLVRDTDNRAACVGQAVVTMIATFNDGRLPFALERYDYSTSAIPTSQGDRSMFEALWNARNDPSPKIGSTIS